MENVVFTQLSIPEIRKLFREELEGYFALTPNQQKPAQEPDNLLTVQEAADLLHLSKATVYGKVSSRELPHSKQGKRLYFSKAELTSWVQSGRQKTATEVQAEANNYITAKRS